MGVIKTKVSQVYAKARDRNNTHVYRKGARSKVNVPLRTVHFHSGNPKLINNSLRLTVYSKSPKLQVPQKVYETLRLCIIKKLSNLFRDITKADYCIKFTRYPHQLLRFHAIASGVRADRVSQGMSNAYGSPFMRACILAPGENFLQIYLSSKYESKLALIKPELKKALLKAPFKSYMIISKE